MPEHRYPIVLVPDKWSKGGGECWTAWHPDLPGCCGYDTTPALALASLEQARGAWLAVNDELKRPAPLPYSSAAKERYDELLRIVAGGAVTPGDQPK